MTFSPHVDPTPARGATVADASYHAEVPGFPPSLNTPLQGEEAEFSGSSLFGPDNGQSPSWGFKPSRLHLGLSPSGYSDGSSVASPGHALPASEPAMIYDVRAASCVAPPSPSPAIVHPAISGTEDVSLENEKVRQRNLLNSLTYQVMNPVCLDAAG